MSPVTLESFLARIYTDTAARAAFLRDPAGEARRAGLAPAVADAMETIDAAGVEATAAAFARKAVGRRDGAATAEGVSQQSGDPRAAGDSRHAPSDGQRPA